MSHERLLFNADYLAYLALRISLLDAGGACDVFPVTHVDSNVAADGTLLSREAFGKF